MHIILFNNWMICCDMLLFLYVTAFRVLRYLCTALGCIFVVLNGFYKYIWVELSLWIELVLLISVIDIAMCLYYWLSMHLNRSVNPEASQHLTTHVSNNSIRMKQLHTAVVRVSALHTLLFHADYVTSSAKRSVCSLSLHNKFNAAVSLQSAVLSVYLINLSKHLLLSHTEWQEGS